MINCHCRDIIDTYSKGLATIGELLLSSISLNMELERNTLLKEHKGISQALRINYYPPCSKPDQVLGISPHSDTSSITILLQEDHLHGLQIHHNDEWIPVKPIPNALVINIGDVIEVTDSSNLVLHDQKFVWTLQVSPFFLYRFGVMGNTRASNTEQWQMNVKQECH